MAATQSRKSVIVTGGNTGLGFQCARFMGVDADILVVIACRDVRSGNEAEAKLRQQGVAPPSCRSTWHRSTQ